MALKWQSNKGQFSKSRDSKVDADFRSTVCKGFGLKGVSWTLFKLRCFSWLVHGNSNMLAQSEFEIKQLVTDRVSKGLFRHRKSSSR